MKKVLLTLLACMMLFAAGCAKKQTSAVAPEGQQEAKQEETVVVEEEVVIVEEETVSTPVVKPTPMEVYTKSYDTMAKAYTVKKGDCLWWISEKPSIYNDPFMWPLIYKNNRDQIKNPDLIFPGQTFAIDRDGFDLAAVKAARKQAGAPWKMLAPAASANLPAKIRKELGYGF